MSQEVAEERQALPNVNVMCAVLATCGGRVAVDIRDCSGAQSCRIPEEARSDISHGHWGRQRCSVLKKSFNRVPRPPHVSSRRPDTAAQQEQNFDASVRDFRPGSAGSPPKDFEPIAELEAIREESDTGEH